VSENFGGIGMCLSCSWKDIDEQILNVIYLLRFGFKMWEILIYKWFLPLKIQINYPKNQVLKGTISWVENVVALEGLSFNSIQAWFPFIFGYSNDSYIHCKTMFICWVSLFCSGFTFGTLHVEIEQCLKACRVQNVNNFNYYEEKNYPLHFLSVYLCHF
jgi:hypothetical protein